MKLPISPFLFFAASLCFYSCSNSGTKSKEVTEINQPEFADGGRTIDSLKKIYSCENIEYDNWGDKKTSDSCLTVCLINSTKVPESVNPDEGAEQLKRIAMAIKKSLAKPQSYKSFYIIFVKKDNFNGMEIKSHTTGMEIPSSQL